MVQAGSTYLRWRLLNVDPESSQIDDETSKGNGKEFQLQMEGQDFKQELNLRLDNGTEQEHLHQTFLAFLSLLLSFCSLRVKKPGYHQVHQVDFSRVMNLMKFVFHEDEVELNFEWLIEWKWWG